ncbi:sensor histidine kinase [Streptomyces microflavus]|uniref:histidine kinase n=1 Tax=Streptomyces microflavus TaxID=1919 RepID=A0A7H8MKA2_STRMI|nr:MULTISPECIES: sensor histidine kinase [Streptomyces]MBK5992011.1 sensor domain-containing protein [Streptomyces sp. MBT58]OXY86806.1 histidine kinase [Streptomyces sp. 2R]QKW42620.1 sensor domain-containing protein [Streptomyces microflavus]WTF68895.1 sensor domain-containing protein [Streptomyces microflavus]
MNALAPRIRPPMLAAGRGLVLSVYGLAVSIVLFVLAVVSIAFVLLGIGVFTTPVVLQAVRRHANQRRFWAADWSGVRIAAPYRPFPPDLRGGVTGQVERTTLLLKDPATWRDLQWLLVDMTVGPVVAMLAAALLIYPVEGLVLAAGLWHVFRNDPYWYGFVPVDSQGTALAALALGVVILAVGLKAAEPLLRLHFLIARPLLAPTPEQTLAQRVDRLTETRHEAVDTAASELRRIERDLHDGAQARLVAMGMNLGTIEALIEKDPAQAKKMLAMARESSAEALTELRDLVRGIHPPVLAERGLGDAVRALALRLPVATEVTVELPGRAEASVESAAYFAVSEALTNAVKHAGGDRIWVDLHHGGGMLRISVTDNGGGGARIGSGSGLSGIERRLGTFDGVLAVSSPAGGPTMVTMELPCALS